MNRRAIPITANEGRLMTERLQRLLAAVGRNTIDAETIAETHAAALAFWAMFKIGPES